MSLPLQLSVIVFAIALLGFVLHLVAQGRLVLKYSLLWLTLAVAILICAIFPQIVYACAKFAGFSIPSNFALLAGVLFLLVIALSLSIIVSWQSQYIRRLVQEMALIRKKLDDVAEDQPES